MNTFKRKGTLWILSLFAVLLMAGCASSNKEFYSLQTTLIQQSMTLAAKDKDLAIEREKTRQKQYDALVAMKDKLDAGGASAFAVSANMSEALGGSGGGKGSGADASAQLLTAAATMRPPESTEDKAFKWAGLILGGGRLFVDRLNARDQVNAQRDTTLGLYSMIQNINHDTGDAVARAVDGLGPTTSNTVTISNGQGVSLFGSTANWATSSTNTLTNNCASGAGAAGGAGGTGGAPGTVTGTTGGAGGTGGAGAGSGPAPCTNTHGSP